MSKTISVKSTVWEDYYFDDDEYDLIMAKIRHGEITVDNIYDNAYDSEINYDTIASLKDSNGNPIVEADDGKNPFTGEITTNQPDPTITKPAYIAGSTWSPGMPWPKEDEDNELII